MRRYHFSDFWASAPEPTPFTKSELRAVKRAFGLRRVGAVPSCPGYATSTCGRTFSKLLTSTAPDEPFRELVQQRRDKGRYMVVSVCAGRKSRPRFVHRLVAETFHGPCPKDKPFVLHRDDDPTRNDAANLYYGSRADNVRDAQRNGRIRKGDNHQTAKLTLALARELRRAAASGASKASLMRKYGIGETTFYDVTRGRRWPEPKAA